MSRYQKNEAKKMLATITAHPSMARRWDHCGWQLRRHVRTMRHLRRRCAASLLSTIASSKAVCCSGGAKLPIPMVGVGGGVPNHLAAYSSRLGLDPSLNRFHAPLVYHENYSFADWPEHHTFPVSLATKVW
jgi:hypothetical protein